MGIVWLLLGMGAGWAIARLLGPETSISSTTVTEQTAQARCAEEPAGLSDEANLALQLHKIDESLEPFARNAAHSNEIATHPDFRRAVALMRAPTTPLADVVAYAFGQTWTLSCAAFVALKERTDSATVAFRIPEQFDNLAAWQMRFAFDFLCAVEDRPPPGAPLIGFRDWWLENRAVQQVFYDYFQALGDDVAATAGTDVEALPFAQRQSIRSFLLRLRQPLATRLAATLGADEPSTSTNISPFLGALGRLWNADSERTVLVEPQGWQDALIAAERLALREPARTLLVSGEPLTGKTSFLRLLAARLEPKGWRVFEASAADLQAGQQYIGQLEGRIRQAIDELDVSKNLIWYIPDLLACAMSGTHQSQSASILDQILPALSTGRVMVWTEATPAAAARLIQLRPGLRRVLEMLRLAPMTEDEALTVAGDLAARLVEPTGGTFAQSFPQTAVDVAQHYLTAMSLPGSALALMKLTVQRLAKAKAYRIDGHDVLETLSQMTGLPLSLLDGAEKLDLTDINNFFTERVVGQPEAVASIVERIAMLKSGLNDPAKPIGVFLFAGPTGTGKTELAKTAAEYLFGSQDRMIRLDMSEYQTFEAVAKILGGGGLPADADTLIARIRKQPFSLLLLDEFEKSHPQIWDLFLQVFDEGRLTDAYGQVADFRHALIILTTNLGATAHRDSGMGFKPAAATFTNEQVLRSISQTFRPEFQNRLDKVIVFKPLTRELMRGILKKELDRIFERRGLKDRTWAVEWDASALEFLLEKGFTPEMGARPLKRAIDQYLIAPLAATIVERRFPEGDQFVFVRRDGDALKSEFVDPNSGEDGETIEPAGERRDYSPSRFPNLSSMMLAATGNDLEAAALTAALEPVLERISSEQWILLKSQLSARINRPEFWTDPERFQALSKFELMDRIAVAADTAQSLQARLQRRQGPPGKGTRDLTSRLAKQVYLLKEGLQDVDDNMPPEVALAIEPVFNSPGPEGEAERSWCADILAMYRAWAEKRNMTLTDLDAVENFALPVLIIAGFGAYRILGREAGLHVQDGIESTQTTSRMTARVLIAPIPLTAPAGNTSTKTALRHKLSEGLAKLPRTSQITRRYRLSPSPLVRNADGSWRSGKVDNVLAGDFDILQGAP